jgi:hypothetical protein
MIVLGTPQRPEWSCDAAARHFNRFHVVWHNQPLLVTWVFSGDIRSSYLSRTTQKSYLVSFSFHTLPRSERTTASYSESLQSFANLLWVVRTLSFVVRVNGETRTARKVHDVEILTDRDLQDVSSWWDGFRQGIVRWSVVRFGSRRVVQSRELSVILPSHPFRTKTFWLWRKNENVISEFVENLGVNEYLSNPSSKNLGVHP